jgi:hypothetical protein
MQLFGIIALFVGVAVAAPTILTERDAPSGHEVQISGFTYNGAGCPRNTVSSVLSDDLTTMTLIYGDAFTAQAGKGIEPKERLKNCQVNVKLHFPQGWQFSVFKADYRGRADLPKGASGTCKATYYFSGDSRQVSRTVTFQGPYDDNYLKTDIFGVESTVWSPCGAAGMLNINSEIKLNPLASEVPAVLTATSTDLTFKQIQYLQWRKCTRKA